MEKVIHWIKNDFKMASIVFKILTIECWKLSVNVIFVADLNEINPSEHVNTITKKKKRSSHQRIKRLKNPKQCTISIGFISEKFKIQRLVLIKII